MTPKEREAMQQALEALHNTQNALLFVSGSIEQFIISNMTADAHYDADKAITALREALAEQVHTPYCKQAPMCKTPCGNSDCVEQAEQEPVAWALSHSMGLEFGSKYPIQETKEAAEQMARQHMGAVVVTPLYAAPVRTKDLTDDEIVELWRECDGMSVEDYARAVIAADREKNK